jgi:hypothetical protein
MGFNGIFMGIMAKFQDRKKVDRQRYGFVAWGYI